MIRCATAVRLDVQARVGAEKELCAEKTNLISTYEQI